MLKVNSISFAYLNDTVIDNVSFTINKGQHIAIIGESGCGKSTLLQLIYGLFDLDRGTLFWNNTQILGPSYHLVPGESYMKYLAQDFDLMPFISAADNINKYLSRFEPEESKKRTAELLEVVDMTSFSATKVKFLSGGQKQRIAIARAIAKEPEVLLLDEPFSHIDTHRKNKLRRKIFAYLKQKNITCIIATHDSTDVLSHTDETIVMKNGALTHKEKTLTLYNNPPNLYTASLFDEVNQIKASLFDATLHESTTILVYPHELSVSETITKCQVMVQHIYFKGSYYLIEAVIEQQAIFFTHHTFISIGTNVYLSISNNVLNTRIQ